VTNWGIDLETQNPSENKSQKGFGRKRVARIELATKAWEALKYADFAVLSWMEIFVYPNVTPIMDPAYIFRLHQLV
jgi:hypothetical protein